VSSYSTSRTRPDRDLRDHAEPLGFVGERRSGARRDVRDAAHELQAEVASHHRADLQQRAHLAGERGQVVADRAAYAIGDGRGAGSVAVIGARAQHPQELAHEERVALGRRVHLVRELDR
jgi:hypothetical protein